MDIRANFENILGQEFDAQLHTHQDRLKGFLMAQSQVQDWKQKAISFIAEKDTDNDDADDLFWESLVSWVSQEWSNTKSPKTEEVNTDKVSAVTIYLDQNYLADKSPQTGRSASFDAFDWKRILVRVQVPKKNATFDFMVGAIEAIAPFDKIFRRGLTQELFLEAVWKAIDVPEGKRLSWTKELIYVSGDTRWNLHKKEDFNAALLRFEESKDEDAKNGMMVVTIEDEKPRVDMTEFWRNISSQG